MELTFIWQRDSFLLDETSIPVADSLLEAARRFGKLEVVAWALTMRGMTALFLYPRRLDEAEKHLREGMATAERAGSLEVRVVGLCYLTSVYRARGDVTAVKPLAQELLRDTNKSPFYRGAALAHLGWADLREGNYEQARENARTAWGLFAGQYRSRYVVDIVLMKVAFAEDDIASAIQTIQEMTKPSGWWRLPDPIIQRFQSATAAWDANQPAVARVELNRAFQLAEEMGYD